MAIAFGATEYKNTVGPPPESIQYVSAINFPTANYGYPVLYLAGQRGIIFQVPPAELARKTDYFRFIMPHLPPFD
jgi:hypothetical protein